MLPTKSVKEKQDKNTLGLQDPWFLLQVKNMYLNAKVHILSRQSYVYGKYFLESFIWQLLNDKLAKIYYARVYNLDPKLANERGSSVSSKHKFKNKRNYDCFHMLFSQTSELTIHVFLNFYLTMK